MSFFAGVLPGQETGLKERLDQLEERLKKLEESLESSAPAAGDPKAAQMEELRQQIRVLSSELEKVRSGEPEAEVSPEQASAMGLGPSAASVYRKGHGVSIAGYGEMLYQNFNGENQVGTDVRKGSQLDFLRAVLYAGYRFNDKFVFNSEIEFEHANTGKGGEVAVEFAYLDYIASKNFTLRGGLLLVPMGLTNEFHEPTAYLGARRSETETQIIPSTWRENGFGVVGSAGRFSYRAYLVNGLNAANFTAEGLRGGRQSGAKAAATDPAFVGRVDFAVTPGVFVGGSIYTGDSGQGQFVDAGRTLGVRTTIGEAHGQMQIRGIDLRALYARASIDDIAELNRLRGITGDDSLGGILEGGYVQIGYNVLSRHSETVRLTPYYRFENVNSQKSLPTDFIQDPATNRRFHTFGLELRPIPNIAIKGDYQWVRNRALTGLNQFNINLGYNF